MPWPLREMENVEMVGGVDTPQSLHAFNAAPRHPSRQFDSVETAIEWGAFDAVTNVTPDAIHYLTTMPFLKAGKHVLCEKPLARATRTPPPWPRPKARTWSTWST